MKSENCERTELTFLARKLWCSEVVESHQDHLLDGVRAHQELVGMVHHEEDQLTGLVGCQHLVLDDGFGECLLHEIAI